MSEEEREESAAGKGGEADARKKGPKRKGVWGKPSESAASAREAQPDRETRGESERGREGNGKRGTRKNAQPDREFRGKIERKEQGPKSRTKGEGREAQRDREKREERKRGRERD